MKLNLHILPLCWYLVSFCPCVVFSAGSQVFSFCKVTLVNTASLQRQHFCWGLTLSKHVIVMLCLLIVNSFSSISLVKDSCKGSKMFTPMTKTENSHRNDSFWCRLKVSVSQMHCKSHLDSSVIGVLRVSLYWFQFLAVPWVLVSVSVLGNV